MSESHKVSDLGRYRLIAELARGGMGIVYLALVRGPGGFNKLFVVKELKQHLTEDPALISMFLEEARLAAKLSHPNVVQTIEVGSEGDRHFIAMEFLDGQSLNKVVARSKTSQAPLPLHYQLHILASLLEGLQYAHGVTDYDGSSLGLVHRDVSPHNVFVTYDGQVKVLDFGIAKAFDSSGDTRTGVLKGKVSYMAPEQAAGQSLDRRADVFSAGVMLWEAVVGQRMWSKATNDLQILHALTSSAIPKPREVRPDIDSALERIILKATAPKKDDRYASAAEMQNDLDAYLKELRVPSFGPRDIGKFVNDMFATERARIKSIIDDQIRTIKGLASTGEIAALDMPYLTTASNPTGASGVLFVEPPPSTESQRRESQRVSVRSSAPIVETLTAVEGRGSVPVPPLFSGPPVEMTTSSRAPWIVAGAVIVVASGVLVGMRLQRAPSVTGAVVAPTLPAAPATLAPSSMRATITATPRESRIAVDEGAPQTGTFEGLYARDGSRHTIRVDAPKFQSKIVTFTAEADHTFDISLEPVREGNAASHQGTGRAWKTAPTPRISPTQTPAAAPAPAPDKPAAPASSPTGKPKQQIETRDPYAQ